MRASSPSPGSARPGQRSSPGPPSASHQVSWPSLAHKARLLFAQWSAAAAAARRALALADHVRARLALLLLSPSSSNANDINNPWSACGHALRSSSSSSDKSSSVRDRVVDAHLLDAEEELRHAAAARARMAEAARAMGRLAAAAAAGAAALSAPASRALGRQLAPGPAPLEVAESLQDVWCACAAENQLHEAAAARCVLLGAVEQRGGRRRASGVAGAASDDAAWAAALAVLEAEVNVDRARFEAFFDAVQNAWPS